MKLLFDQNLSHHLCRLLAAEFPDSEQVKSVGLERANDIAIWAFARQHGYMIVTLDADFSDISGLRGTHPKVIWLRCGNQPTKVIERLLRNQELLIAEFSDSDDAICLEIY